MPDGNGDEFEYDVALSLAGEDRGYVQPIAERLRDSGVRVFYDGFEQGAMWGEDVLVFLDEVFRKRSRYAVVFISRRYVEKHWPTHEGKSAQARALIQDSPYFLPVRLDDSELPGLRPTVGYIDAREVGREKLIDLILDKVAVSRPVDRVPRTPEEEAYLLTSQPDGWEYLLFASVLRRRLQALDPKWRDHVVGYRQPAAAALDEGETHEMMSSVFAEMRPVIGNVERLLSEESQLRCFGAPGEPGDQEQIQHLAERLIDVYRELLDWSARVRGAAVPERYERLFEIASKYVDGPIRQFREFVDRVVAEMDRVPAALRDETPFTIALTLTLELDDGVEDEFSRELARLEE